MEVPLLLLLLLLLLLFAFPGSLPSGGVGGSNPAGAAHKDVRRFRKGQDAPSGNSRRLCESFVRSAKDARQGVLSLVSFSLHEQRVHFNSRMAGQSNSRRQARKLLFFQAVSNHRICLQHGRLSH